MELSGRIKSSVFLYDLPQRGYIAIVLFQAVREAMMPVAVAHEIVIISACWMHRSLQRTSTRVANGARRKTGMSVGIVGRVETHVGVMESASIDAFQLFRIDDAGIGLQCDVLRQAVLINAGHERALLRCGGFLLHNRSERDYPLHI